VGDACGRRRSDDTARHSYTVASNGDPISFTGISAAYKDLVLEARIRGNDASTAINSYVRFNGDNGNNYDAMGVQSTGAVVQNFSTLAGNASYAGATPSGGSPASFFSAQEIEVQQYASTTMEKTYRASGYGKGTNATASMFTQTIGGSWRSTAAINRVDLIPGAGAGWAAGQHCEPLRSGLIIIA
jgi:acyl CoA:acetate/3-ketoacid CoA transferase alpha subunit